MRQACITCLTLIVLLLACTRSENSELVHFAAQGNADRVRELLRAGVSADIVAVDGWTPLTAAAAGGHLHVVEMLIAAGANVNKPEAGGNSALFWASFYGHLEVVKYLLANGADRNLGIPSTRGKIKLPIDVARERGYPNIVALLKDTKPEQ
jgi:ankyrin repeat protein